MELEIEQDAESEGGQLFYSARTFGCKKLAPNFEEVDCSPEPTRQGARRLQSIKIQG